MTTAIKDVEIEAPNVPAVARRIKNILLRNFSGEQVDNGDIIKADCPFCCGLKIGKWCAADQVFDCPKCSRYGILATAKRLDIRTDAPEVHDLASITITGHAAAIRKIERRLAGDIVEIGRLLREVKKAIPGRFTSWAQDEFGWSERAARLFMRVFEVFGETANFADLQFDQTALYLLSAKKAPQAATEEAIDRARAGEKITHKLAKEIIAKFTEEDERKAADWTLAVAIEELRKGVARYQELWPQEYIDALGHQLRELGEEIIEHDGLIE